MSFPRRKSSSFEEELEKLQKNLGGIKEMKRIPDAIFIVDPKKERICVQEAHTLGIPLIGICDTNCDPEELDYVIPGNDDAIRAVKLIVSKMADAVIEANQGQTMLTARSRQSPKSSRETSSRVRRVRFGGITDGYYSSTGKRVKRDDRRRYDGLQESPYRDRRRYG